MGIDGGGLSVADALALGSRNNDNNDGWGGGNGYWIFFLFFLLAWGNGGWGGFGNGNGAGLQGALTRDQLCQDMNFQSMENAIRGIQSGICDGFYAMNTGMLNGFAGVNSALQAGFAGVDNAVCTLGYNMQQGFNTTNIALMQGQNALSAQLAQCCCENRAGQADIKYQMATDTCAIQNTIQNTTRDIIDNNNCNTRQILDFMVNTRLQELQTENQNLKLAASQERQNNYLVNALRPCPQPAYITCNPFTGGYGYGSAYGPYGGNCGCNNNCGCGC